MGKEGRENKGEREREAEMEALHLKKIKRQVKVSQLVKWLK